MNKKHFKIKRGKSGLGLFTKHDIKKGELVIEYTGERVTTEEADKRSGRYLFTIDKEWALDAKDRKHVARYINHSCRPNCYAEVDEDARKINIYAKRAIKKEEELSYHYGREYWEDFIGPRKCRCPKCVEQRKRN